MLMFILICLLKCEGKSKSKFVPLLDQTPHSEGFRGGCITRILYGGEWLASRFSRINPGENVSGGPQSRCELFRGEIRPLLMPGIKLLFLGRPPALGVNVTQSIQTLICVIDS
jgi:hypothetical protein